MYDNYKGDYRLPRMCPHCEQEEDTTEHLVECEALGPSCFHREDMKNDQNIELWKQMIERIQVNMKWRRK